jgi:hypothetical protein
MYKYIIKVSTILLEEIEDTLSIAWMILHTIVFVFTSIVAL